MFRSVKLRLRSHLIVTVVGPVTVVRVVAVVGVDN